MKKIWLVTIIFLAILVVGYATWSILSNPASQQNNQATKKSTNGNCRNPQPVTFTYAPLNIEDIGYIIPMGRTANEHITPTDHTYFAPASFDTSSTHYPVYAPADGNIKHVEWVQRPGDFRLIINHSCAVSTIFIHLNKLSDSIARETTALANQKNVQVDIDVKAGDILGYIGGETFDFSAHDTTTTLEGYANPSRYAVDEPWRIHTVDTFEYFTPQLAKRLKAKTIRSVPPVAGRIDYDIAGTIQGVWYLAGVDAFGDAERLSDYWKSHLTISPHHLDPGQFIFAIGDYLEKPAALAISDPAPPPHLVMPASGPVKYELKDFNFIIDATGEYWDRRSFAKSISVAPSQLQGTVLLQLINDTTLKLELFPSRAPSEVTSFTSAARTYER